MRILWMTLGLIIPSVSFGWGEPCPTGVVEERFATQLVSIEAALTSGKLEKSRAALSEIHKHLLCMEQVVSAPLMSRLGTLFAMTFFFDQDDDASQRWMRGAQYAVEKTTWPAVIGESHPLRDLEADLEWLISTQENTGFLVPKKATVFMSGRFVAQPTVPVETPLLVQVADRKGRVLASWWQDGAAFPEDRLLAGGPPLSQPSWWEATSRGRSTEMPKQAPESVAKAPEPVIEEPVAVAPTPVAVAPTPVAEEPVAVAPAPVVEEPVAVAPAPVVEEPVAVAPAPAPVVEEPVAVAPAPVAKAPVSRTEALETEPTQYIDPFQAARTRRILRERSERTIEGPEGQQTIVRTEIVSFVPDPSNGRPVTHQHYEQWLKDSPEWHKAAAISRGDADDGYLTGWADTRHPDGARKRPMVWIPFSAAKAYCESFGGELETSTFQAADAFDWEWRIRDEQGVRVSPKGKVKQEKSPSTSYDDVGFRCKK